MKKDCKKIKKFKTENAPRFHESGELSSAPRSGRPRATSGQQDAAILHASEESPMTNAVAVWQQLRECRRHALALHAHCTVASDVLKLQ